MAVAFRAASTVAVAAHTSMNPSLPTGTQSGDFLFLSVRVSSASGKTFSASGMTKIGQLTQASDGWVASFFWAVSDGSTTPTVTWDGTSLSSGCTLAAYSGAD